MLNLHADNILLGMGGSNPGLDAYSAISGSLEKILSLDAGQSVYAIDICPEGRTIAAGTKNGAINWLRRHGSAQTDDEFLVQQQANGASILSISFVEESTLAVADTAGRCLLWELGSHPQPKELPTGKRIICALFRLDARHLAGLAISGELVVWDWQKGEIVEVAKVPNPPEDLVALIKPLYWPAAKDWVWGGGSGSIVFYNWPGNEVRVVGHHATDVYAMVVCRDELLTIGRMDGRANHWCTGAGEPVGSFEAPRGIISATSWDWQDRTMVLLINDAGKAGVYSWANSGFDLIKSLSGEDYRIAVGPDMEKFTVAMQQQKTRRVQELAALINERISRQEWTELETHYDELDKLGYSHVALALRGREARSKDDLVAELNIYRQLAGIIPHEQPGSESVLARYAELLESVWQLPKARLLNRELTERYPDNRIYAEAAQRISEYTKSTKDGGYVIETCVPVLSIVKAAAGLGEEMAGRYVLKVRKPVSCRVVISAGDLIGKYEQLCDKQSQMPRAAKKELCWLSNDRAEQVTTVVFGNEDSDRFSHIELGIKFFNARLQTVLVPVIMLNADSKTRDTSKEQHNQNVLEELQYIEDDYFKGWLEIVEHTINQAIRQLISRAKGLADGNRWIGAKQC